MSILRLFTICYVNKCSVQVHWISIRSKKTTDTDTDTDTDADADADTDTNVLTTHLPTRHLPMCPWDKLKN